MQTLHLTGINKLLHPERDKRSATERIFDHLSHSNIGLNRGEATADTGSAASALDSFSVTQNISELLSPAYVRRDALSAGGRSTAIPAGGSCPGNAWLP